MGSSTVDEVRQRTYPKDIVSQVDVNHNWFGLVPNGARQSGYAFELRHIPPPPGFTSLNPETFGASYPLYDYE